MADDLSRSFTWGCGVTLGVIFALIGIPLICWLLCCGGLAGLFYGTQEARNAGSEMKARHEEKTGVTAIGGAAAPKKPDPFEVVETPDQKAQRLAAAILRAEQERRRQDEFAAERRAEGERQERQKRQQHDDAIRAAKKAEDDAKANKSAKAALNAAGLYTKPEDKVKVYKDVIAKFPDTAAAGEAKKLLDAMQ